MVLIGDNPVSSDQLDLLLYDSYGKYYGKYSKYNGMNSTHQINIDRLDLANNDDRNKLKNAILSNFKHYIKNKWNYCMLYDYESKLKEIGFMMPDVEFVIELFEDIASHIIDNGNRLSRGVYHAAVRRYHIICFDIIDNINSGLYDSVI